MLGSALRMGCNSAGPVAVALQNALWIWGCSDRNAKLLRGDVLRPSDKELGVLSVGAFFDGHGEKMRY